MKAYVLVKDTIPLGKAINSCVHAGALINVHFPRDNDPIMEEWWNDSFRKVTCKVSEQMFEKAKEFKDWFAVTELTLNKKETILVFKPRPDEEWPTFFKYLTLYK